MTQKTSATRAAAAKAPTPRRKAANEAPRDPMMRLVVSELEAISRMMPPQNLKPPGDGDDAEDAFFDNMPV